MRFIDRGEEKEIAPSDLLSMPRDDASSYINGAAFSVCRAQFPEPLDFLPVRMALENLHDVTFDLLTQLDGARKGEVLENAETLPDLSGWVERLREEAARVVTAAYEKGYPIDCDNPNNSCTFVLDAARTLLESRFKHGREVFAFLTPGGKRHPVASRPSLSALSQ